MTAPTPTSADHQRWPAEWLRGILSGCALAVLAESPNHGYAIAVRLQEYGLGTVKGGTLYPLLARLEEQGLIEATWRIGESGPSRKEYRLTGAGHDALRRDARRWHEFADLTCALLADPSAPTTADDRKDARP